MYKNVIKIDFELKLSIMDEVNMRRSGGGVFNLLDHELQRLRRIYVKLLVPMRNGSKMQRNIPKVHRESSLYICQC